MEEILYQTQPNFILRRIGEESVIVPVGDVGDLENCIISFNETYSFIWKELEQPISIAQIVVHAQELYEAPEGLLEIQIDGAVKELIKKGMVKEAN